MLKRVSLHIVIQIADYLTYKLHFYSCTKYLVCSYILLCFSVCEIVPKWAEFQFQQCSVCNLKAADSSSKCFKQKAIAQWLPEIQIRRNFFRHSQIIFHSKQTRDIESKCVVIVYYPIWQSFKYVLICSTNSILNIAPLYDVDFFLKSDLKYLQLM